MKTICFLLLLSSFAFCQNSLNLEFITGIETGWWVYNKGSTEENITNNLGWDRTRHSIFLPVEFSVSYQIDRYKIGVGINHSIYFEDQMVSSTDTYFFRNVYSIANNSVKFLKMNLLAEFDLIQRSRYALGPIVKFGFFQIDTTHPEKENFGAKTFWTLGLTNEIRLSKFSLIVRPVYNVLTVRPREEKTHNEKHHIYGIGLNFGVRYSIK